MIANNWRKIISREGKTQNALADDVGVNRGEMSRVCAGTAVLPLDTLCRCCKILRCDTYDIYGADEHRVIYQVGLEEKPKKPPRVRVQLAEDVVEMVDHDIEEGKYYKTRAEAVNDILRGAYR